METVEKTAEQVEHDTQVLATKQLRKDTDDIIQRVKELRPSRETSLATTKLQEGVMWLGMQLKALGEANPYPNSKDASNTKIEPTADGLKL
jgi:ClpP class serine protease